MTRSLLLPPAVAGVVGLALLAPPALTVSLATAPAAAAQAALPPAEIAVTVDAGELAPAGAPPPGAEDFEAFLAGRQVAVTGVATIDEPWQVLVYLDPALLTPSGLQDAAAALTRRAELLTELGEVSIVVADPNPLATLAGSRDAAAVSTAFDALAAEGGAAGELIELRYELLEAAEAGGVTGAAASLARRLLADETRLLTRSRRHLLERLAQEDAPGAKLLLLVSDGFDLDPTSFYAGRTAEDGEPAEAETGGETTVPGWRELVRSAAAAGWTAVPLAFGDPGPVLADPTEPLAELATATGSGLVRDARELRSALERTAARLRLTVRVDGDPSGEPQRLEIVARRGGDRPAAPRWAAASTPLAFSVARARAAAGGEPVEPRALPLTAAVDEAAGAGPAGEPMLRVSATGVVRPVPAGAPTALYRLTVFAELLDAPPQVAHGIFAAPPGAARLRFEQTLHAGDLRAAGVVLERLGSGGDGGEGEWAATRAAIGAGTAEPPGAVAAIPWAGAAGPGPDEPASDASPTLPPPVATGRPAPPPAAKPQATAADPPEAGSPSPAGDRVIVLLPPRRAGLGRFGGSASGDLTGRVRLETLVTRPDVARVVFYVDGVEAASDDREPFTATVDLGAEARPRRLRADALSAAGRVLGTSEVELAASGTAFRVAITAVDGDPAGGEVTVAAEVSVPSERRLVRIQWYYNDALATERPVTGSATEGGAFRAAVPTPAAGPNDFLRVVAHLDDGSSLEDARLLSARGEIERVAVNLVELFAVVTDRSGTPLTGLAADDFTVRLDGTELPLERFRLAEEVPLLLGLLVDTSESMWPLLPDTKRAAAKFLADTLRQDDRAFLVSFDDQPRLVRPPTEDLLALLNGFGALRATGRTALYDAIVFSLLQMEGDRGRRALVLLTDGRDWGSRYGPRRATEYGQKLGVPVYILVFGDLYGDRRPLPQPDLDAVTARTGGQVFYIDRLEELDAVYARIADELRSQYVLAVATGRPLSASELGEIEVDAGRGRKVRAAVGGRDLD